MIPQIYQTSSKTEAAYLVKLNNHLVHKVRLTESECIYLLSPKKDCIKNAIKYQGISENEREALSAIEALIDRIPPSN